MYKTLFGKGVYKIQKKGVDIYGRMERYKRL